MNSSPDLPFLLVFGAWVWKAALLGAAALAIGLLWALRALLARRHVRAQLATPPSRGEAEVRGVLRGHDVLATTIYAESSSLARSDGRAELRAATVELEREDGAVVTLEGPLQVVVGSSAAVQRDGVPSELLEAELEEARRQVDWLHRPGRHDRDVFEASVVRLRAGDRVVARGELERRAGTSEATFRGASEALVLRGHGGPVRLYARAPATPPATRPLAIWLGGAALGALLGIIGHATFGDHALQACKEATHAAPWDNSHPCVLASTWRETRAEALERLSALHPPIDGLAALERTSAVLLLSERCSRAVDLWAKYDELERALALAEQCGLRRDAHQLLLRDGRYEEASQLHVAEDVFGPALPSPATLIAAGHWQRAAAALAAEGASDPRRTCLIALLRHHGGDADAVSALRMLGQLHTEACAPMLREATQTPAASARPPDELPHPLALAEANATSFGAISALAMPSASSARYQALPWLVEGLTDAELTPEQRPMVRHWRLVGQVFDGDVAAARRLLSAPVEAGAKELELVLSLLVDLYEGAQTSEPARKALREVLESPDGWRYDFEPLLLRTGLPFSISARYTNGQRPTRALERAREGDGAELLHELSSDYGGMIRDEELLAVWPLVRTHRAELARAVRWRERDRWSRELPYDLAVRAFWRRDLARQLGDEAEAARWQQRYRRADEVLSDRRRLVSLLLLER